MTKYISLILASGVISFLATPLMRRFAREVNFVDNPQARKVHRTPMPMLGGIAIYFGFMIPLTIAITRSFVQTLGILGGATIMTLFGLWDDRVGLSPLVKMIGQVAATVLLILVGIQVKIFDSRWLNIAVTLFWVIGICNAINFQDNMDGLAAGLSMVSSGFFFVLALFENLEPVAQLAAATLGASVGFLYYNFNPASLFMGDAGSLLLGFILAVLGIRLEFVGSPLGATWMIPILVLGVPIFDTTMVVVSRLRRGKPVYEGGKDHTSHRLVSILNMTHARSVMTLYMMSVGLGLVAIMLRDATVPQARIVLIGLGAAFVGLLIWLEVKFNGQQPPTESEQQPG
ncbi:MAG: undecaprenyl/decaprenyl-phosphate alpha-N-acetylglucosaminyl 1-phosphate transferase [Anaerolineae bacterium]|nr:undecaprenyl/decaprenyl-phosphate alpha-N-acetylglucosaminyl 1-phosphate transferase [Anaerolineae bacterium]